MTIDWHIAAATAVAFTIMALNYCALGCGAGTPTAEQQESVAKDAYEQNQCVEQAEAGVGKAAMKAAIDQCRHDVRMRRPIGSP